MNILFTKNRYVGKWKKDKYVSEKKNEYVSEKKNKYLSEKKYKYVSEKKYKAIIFYKPHFWKPT